jgi:acetate kinase
MSSPGSQLLVLNLGSATLKAAWFDEAAGALGPPLPTVRLTLPVALPGASLVPDASDATWTEALDQIAQRAPGGVSPRRVAHRIVHGGDREAPQRLDVPSLAALGALGRWAPLHQARALAMAAAAAARWPDALALGVFDTTWHRGLVASSRALPLAGRWREAGVERYGFHGLAFQSAYRQLCAADPAATEGPVVLAHLGSGASLCAMREGRSVDTTMGLTPLDGVPMATRAGSLDPGVVLHLLRELRGDVDAVEAELSRRSGLRGLSGRSGDMRDLLADASDDARLAIEVFARRVAQAVASMATSAGGLHDLVFSGGIGSHAAPVRAAILESLAWLGVRVDAQANLAHASRIDGPDSRVRVWVVTVDEEGEIARAARAWLAGPSIASP